MDYQERVKLIRKLCVECSTASKCYHGCKEFREQGLVTNALNGYSPDEWLSVRDNLSFLRDPSKIVEGKVNGMRQVTLKVGAYKTCYT